jgi:uncharacterized protein YjbI with pentapeptide repeats
MSRGKIRAARLHWLSIVITVLIAFILLPLLPSLAQETKKAEPPKPSWAGKLPDGREITQADLNQILQVHALCGKSKGKEGQQANLDGADFSGANLFQANLSGASLQGADLTKAKLNVANLSEAFLYMANLSHANLDGANLRGADLFKANLSGASLQEADLTKAKLNVANLSEAFLYMANLSHANLSEANLRGADLFSVNLSEANLQRADLTRANFINANLSGAIFEPLSGSLPDVPSWFEVKGLLTLTYKNSTYGLVELRGIFKKAGMRDQERQVTYALNYTRREMLWQEGGFLNRMESLFCLVCFEWPCGYGLAFRRPLKILILGLFCFSFLYMLALTSRHRGAGLWVVLLPDRVRGQSGKNRPYKLTTRPPFQPLPETRRPGSRPGFGVLSG